MRYVQNIYIYVYINFSASASNREIFRGGRLTGICRIWEETIPHVVHKGKLRDIGVASGCTTYRSVCCRGRKDHAPARGSDDCYKHRRGERGFTACRGQGNHSEGKHPGTLGVVRCHTSQRTSLPFTVECEEACCGRERRSSSTTGIGSFG